LDADIRVSSLPSENRKLFQMVKNQTLSKMIRFSWWESHEAMVQCGITEGDVFSLTAGPVLMYFHSGLVIGAASDPAQNSVLIWVERNDTDYVSDDPIETDTDLFSINALDKQYSSSYWRQIVGHRIEEISIIKSIPQNALLAELANEVGVEFVMDNGNKFIMSHGLHNSSDDFSVITESCIDRRLLENLRWVNVL